MVKSLRDPIVVVMMMAMTVNVAVERESRKERE